MSKFPRRSMRSTYQPLFQSLSSSYDRVSAVNAVKKILEKYSPTCTMEFHPYYVEIVDSYLVTNRKDRLVICEIIARSGATKRSAANLSAEWVVHNLSYRLYILRWAAKDVALDYVRDERFPVRWATWIFEFLGWL